MFKKFLILMLIIMLVGCMPAAPVAGDGRIKIVAAIFPQYDFARVIAGDKADISLLLPPGVESHTYQPTSADVVAIENADMFLHTGESWAKNFQTKNKVDISQNVLISEDDPHIWTDPNNAKIMVDNIVRELCAADPESAEYYIKNAEEYKLQLDELDVRLQSISKGKIVFAGENPMHYFLERYGFDHDAVIDSCGDEGEPAAQAVVRIISEIKEQDIKTVFYTEFLAPSITNTIIDETGAVPVLLHACHNVSKAEAELGMTYLELMSKNAETLEAAFNESN